MSICILPQQKRVTVRPKVYLHIKCFKQNIKNKSSINVQLKKLLDKFLKSSKAKSVKEVQQNLIKRYSTCCSIFDGFVNKAQQISDILSELRALPKKTLPHGTLPIAVLKQDRGFDSSPTHQEVDAVCYDIGHQWVSAGKKLMKYTTGKDIKLFEKV